MDHRGIDVHKKESQICILAEGGELIEQRIRTEPERFAAALGERPRARSCSRPRPTASGSRAASMSHRQTDRDLFFPRRARQPSLDHSGLVASLVENALVALELRFESCLKGLRFPNVLARLLVSKSDICSVILAFTSARVHHSFCPHPGLAG
jgi:hypothetical protein